MPQMSPLPWLTLFALFLILLMISMSMNYFFFMPKIHLSYMKSVLNKMSWKW